MILNEEKRILIAKTDYKSIDDVITEGMRVSNQVLLGWMNIITPSVTQ